jgi:hypothetical protein
MYRSMDILILFKILQVALQNRFAVFPILPSDIDPMTESPLDLIDVSSMILWRTRWELCLPVQLGLRRADLRCFWRRLMVRQSHQQTDELELQGPPV